MQAKDKTLNQQLIDHIDILYKLINDLRLADMKCDKAILNLKKKFDKISKNEV